MSGAKKRIRNPGRRVIAAETAGTCLPPVVGSIMKAPYGRPEIVCAFDVVRNPKTPDLIILDEAHPSKTQEAV